MHVFFLYWQQGVIFLYALFFLLIPVKFVFVIHYIKFRINLFFNVSSIPTLFIVFHISSTPWLCWLYLSQTVLYGDKVSEGGREKFDTGRHDLGRRPAVKAEDCPRCCIQTEEYLFILSVAISLLYIHLRRKKNHENFVFWDVWGGELDWKVTHLLFLFTVIRKLLLPHIYMWLNNKWELCSCFPVSVLCEISSFPSFTAGNEEAKSHGKLVDWSSDAFE